MPHYLLFGPLCKSLWVVPTFKYLHLNIWGRIYPVSYNIYSGHFYLATQLDVIGHRGIIHHSEYSRSHYCKEKYIFIYIENIHTHTHNTKCQYLKNRGLLLAYIKCLFWGNIWSSWGEGVSLILIFQGPSCMLERKVNESSMGFAWLIKCSGL